MNTVADNTNTIIKNPDGVKNEGMSAISKIIM